MKRRERQWGTKLQFRWKSMTEEKPRLKTEDLP